MSWSHIFNDIFNLFLKIGVVYDIDYILLVLQPILNAFTMNLHWRTTQTSIVRSSMYRCIENLRLCT